MKELASKICTRVDELYSGMVAQRRDIHRHPETGWTEFRTAALVVKRLQELGYEVCFGADAVKRESMMGVPAEAVLKEAQARAVSEGADAALVAKMDGGCTGVVATLKTGKPGPVVGLRFDMDCNDVTETTDAAHFPNQQGFASLHGKEMHACGHDGHTTVGLTIAQLLMELKDELAGTVKLVFQPAEEGVRGARAMVENGDVDDVDYMLGAHFGFKMKETGSVACNVTGFLATGKLDASFKGVPAHAGAAPEQGKNALLAAAAAALNLHAISRHSAGVSRINVGKLVAGSGRNVVGDKALLSLETRGGTSEINKYMEEESIRIIKAAAMMYDVEVDITQVGGAAGGNNSPELAEFIQQQAEELGIFDKVVGECDFGASEDFAYFMERVQQLGGQAAYLMVGADLAAGHHDSRFSFDEKAMGYAAKLLTTVTINLLQGKQA